MHPGYTGGYAVSMYAGMGPYATMVPQPAVPYPTSPVLNPTRAAAPPAGFSVPSSSNSSRQTSLSEPMPRPAREKRTSASAALCASVLLATWRHKGEQSPGAIMLEPVNSQLPDCLRATNRPDSEPVSKGAPT